MKQKMAREKARKQSKMLQSEPDIVIPEITEEEFVNATKNFENKNGSLTYTRCEGCHQVRLDMKVKYVSFSTTKSSNLCCSCAKFTESKIEALKEGLPIWKSEKGKVHFELPEALLGLREGEKMMIQRVNVYVNIHYLHLGQTGNKGHCTAFRQDISKIAQVLPRLPEDIQFLQVIKKTTDADKNICEKKFVIRKKKVLTALQ